MEKDPIKQPNNYYSDPAITTCTKKEFSMDDLLDNLTQNVSWKYILLVGFLTFFWVGSAVHLYLTVFAGLDPTPDDSWTCKSQKCRDLVKSNTAFTEMSPCQIMEERNGTQILLLKNEDIIWDLDHTSFSIEFDMYCKEGVGRFTKTFVSSVLFLGSLTGSIFGGYMIDHIGRKRTAIFGLTVLVISLLGGSICHDLALLCVVRYFQGIGHNLQMNAMSVLCLELVPRRFRDRVTAAFVVFFSFGYFVAPAVYYCIHDWNFKFLGAAIVVALSGFAVFLSIESPRFYLIKNDLESTLESLKVLASLNDSDYELDKLNLKDYMTVSSKNREQSLRQQLKEQGTNPPLLGETLLQTFLWFSAGTFLFGVNFGWTEIVPNIYLAYVMSGVGELLSLIFVRMIKVLGRRRAYIIAYLAVMTCFLLAIPDVDLGGKWTLESVFCLVSVVFSSGCYSALWLWTGELAPTTHRGLILSICSTASTVGSFAGPYIFNNLGLLTSRAVPFGGLAIVAALCAGGSFLLVETGDKNICFTGQDVVERRNRYYRYRI